MTTFEWMNPQTTGILFLWAPVGAKKLGVRFKSRSAVGVSFSTSNTLGSVSAPHISSLPQRVRGLRQSATHGVQKNYLTAILKVSGWLLHVTFMMSYI